MLQPWSIHEGAAAHAAESRGKVSDGRRLAGLCARDLGLRDKHAADSIPIARHLLCGRFSPTGSFAYRSRKTIRLAPDHLLAATARQKTLFIMRSFA
jgi:hypothetical protein